MSTILSADDRFLTILSLTFYLGSLVCCFADEEVLPRFKYSAVFQAPVTCLTLGNANQHYYFSSTASGCLPCAQTTQYQHVKDYGTSCGCQIGYRIIKDFGGEILCEACPPNQYAAQDGWQCVTCTEETHGCTACPSQGSILVHSDMREAKHGSSSTSRCISCLAGTIPDNGKNRCIRCDQILSMLDTKNCFCPATHQIHGLCFQHETDVKTLITSEYGNVYFGGDTFPSNYFQSNVGNLALCRYGNRTSCQLLANLCALSLYAERGICVYYRAIVRASQYVTSFQIPRLYYPARSVTEMLKSRDITSSYQVYKSPLTFNATTYHVDGSFLGHKPITTGFLQLCGNPSGSFDRAAFTYAVEYQLSCHIPAQLFLDHTRFPPHLYELWFTYSSSDNKPTMFSVPVYIHNAKNSAGEDAKHSSVPPGSMFQRFFFVDSISGISAQPIHPHDETNDHEYDDDVLRGRTIQNARYIRYAKKVSLVIVPRSESNDRQLIYPPHLEITYAYLTSADLVRNTLVQVSFDVVYVTDGAVFEHELMITCSVLSVLAALYGIVQTRVWLKRSDWLRLNLIVLVKFIVITSDFVGNILVIVLFVASLLYIGYRRVTLDVFFIDWEKPAAIVPAPAVSGWKTVHCDEMGSVSMWRIYIVANYWIKLQTRRRTNHVLRIIFSLILLVGVKFVKDFLSGVSYEESGELNSEFRVRNSFVNRYACICSVYGLIGLGQWLWSYVYFYFVGHPLYNLIDLCSMSNISLLVMESELYGYYVHGQNIHTHADVSLAVLHHQLIHEARDLCRPRGLVDDEDQTFEITLTRKMRAVINNIYRNVYDNDRNQNYSNSERDADTPRKLDGEASRALDSSGSSVPVKTILDTDVKRVVDGFARMTLYLQLFINQRYKNNNYIVTKKSAIEEMFHCEAQRGSKSSYFYRALQHFYSSNPSFTTMTFFGNDLKLIIFEMTSFAFLDFFFVNYLLSAIILYLFTTFVLHVPTKALGKINIAKKSFLDSRFLI